MYNCKLSVIIPIYNSEKYLNQCLESIVNQTLKDIEIICINDGSSDSSSSILNQFAQSDGRIKVITKQKNEGYGSALNTGIEIAQGEYIGFVDSDDFISPEMYEKLYSLANEYNADIVKCGWYNYYSQTDSFELFEPYPAKYVNDVFKPVYEKEIYKLNPVIWSGIYKNELIKQHKCLETQGAAYQDISLLFKLLTFAQKIYLINEPYVYYRKDNEDSVNNKTNVYSVVDETREIERFAETVPVYKYILIPLSAYVKYSVYKWNIIRLDMGLKKKFINFATEELMNDFKKNKFDKSLFSRFEYNDLILFKDNPEKYYKNILKQEKLKQIQKLISSYIFINFKNGKFELKIMGKTIL